MSRFLQVYEPDTGLMLTQESIDFMMGKCDPDFIIATEGFGDIMKKIWDAIVKFFKWILEKLKKLYDSMKEFVKKLAKKKDEIKEAQKEKEKKALNKIVNDTVGGHEKAANELTDEMRKSTDKMEKVMSDADKKSSGGLKPKDYYSKRREEAHKDFKKADADMKDNLDKTAKATAKVHDVAASKQEEPAKKEPPKEEPKKEEPAKEEPKNEAIDVDGLIYNFNGSDFEKALDAGLKGLEKITLMCKKILDNIKVDRSDPEKTVNNNDANCFEPIFKIINDIFERYKVREHTDAKWGSSKDGNNSMHFENVDELSKLIEKRLMPGCQNLHKMLNKIVLFLDTVSSKDTIFDYSLSQKYGERARKLDDSKLTDHERELRAMFNKLRRSFKSIAECATRIYNTISHDYHKMDSAAMKIKFG